MSSQGNLTSALRALSGVARVMLVSVWLPACGSAVASSPSNQQDLALSCNETSVVATRAACFWDRELAACDALIVSHRPALASAVCVPPSDSGLRPRVGGRVRVRECPSGTRAHALGVQYSGDSAVGCAWATYLTCCPTAANVSHSIGVDECTDGGDQGQRTEWEAYGIEFGDQSACRSSGTGEALPPPGVRLEGRWIYDKWN